MARKLKMFVKTAANIKKKQRFYTKGAQANESLEQWRLNYVSGHGFVINKCSYKWFVEKKACNMPINGPMLVEKAIEFATAIGYTGFKGSNG